MHMPLTPIRFLYRAVDLFGKKIGIVSGDRQFTYAEFGSAMRAARLCTTQAWECNQETGSRILSFNTNQLIEGYYGVPMAGGIVMPLNVRLTPSELGAILKHSGAKILFYEPEFDSDAADLPVERVFGWMRITNRCSHPTNLNASTYMDVDENSTAELFYTSGSTGTPKGVMLSHRTVYLHAISVVHLLCRALTTWWTCTRSRCFTPTDGVTRTPPR